MIFKFQQTTVIIVSMLLGFQVKGDTIKVKLYFFDLCSQSVKKLDFDLIGEKDIFNSQNSAISVKEEGTYILSTGIISGDFVGSHSEIINLEKGQNYVDTIEIPRIKLTTETALHSRYWNYFNCDSLCKGQQIEYYSNGNMRLLGLFKQGKPLEITEYRENGTKEIKSFYKLGYLTERRIEYYDENGELEEYEIYKYHNGRKIIKTYDENDKFIEKTVEKYYIEK